MHTIENSKRTNDFATKPVIGYRFRHSSLTSSMSGVDEDRYKQNFDTFDIFQSELNGLINREENRLKGAKRQYTSIFAVVEQNAPSPRLGASIHLIPGKDSLPQDASGVRDRSLEFFLDISIPASASGPVGIQIIDNCYRFLIDWLESVKNYFNAVSDIGKRKQFLKENESRLRQHIQEKRSLVSGKRIVHHSINSLFFELLRHGSTTLNIETTSKINLPEEVNQWETIELLNWLVGNGLKICGSTSRPYKEYITTNDRTWHIQMEKKFDPAPPIESHEGILKEVLFNQEELVKQAPGAYLSRLLGSPDRLKDIVCFSRLDEFGDSHRGREVLDEFHSLSGENVSLNKKTQLIWLCLAQERMGSGKGWTDKDRREVAQIWRNLFAEVYK